MLKRSRASTVLTPSGDPLAEISLGTSASRMLFLAGMGIVLGGLGGVAAYLVVHLVGLISNLALLHQIAFNLPNLRHYHPGLVLIPVTMGGALVVALLAKWAPVIKGHGIPESIEAIMLRDSRIPPRAALAKPISAAVAMGTGGPFGAEGPIIVTGASIGSLLGQLMPVTPAERRILLATGAAAGMAGVFNTPIAAIVLAFELLLFERSLRALLPLTLATGIAASLHIAFFGAEPLFALGRALSVPPTQLPLFALLGVVIGALAVTLNKGLFIVESLFRRLPISEFWHPIIGAVGVSGVGLLVPGSLSVGYWAITDAVNNRFLLGSAAILCVAKTVSWWLGLGSNTSGGTLAPMFLIGATMGEVVGIALVHVFPGAHIDPGTFALVAMGVSFGVGTEALLTGVIFAAEVTGGYGMFVPLLLATGVAEVVVERFLQRRLMTEKLFHRGYRVDFAAETDPLRMRAVGMLREESDPTDQEGVRSTGELHGGTPRYSIDQWAFVSEALPLFLEHQVCSLDVTAAGKIIGVLRWSAVSELLKQRSQQGTPQPPTLRLWKNPRVPSGGVKGVLADLPSGGIIDRRYHDSDEAVSGRIDCDNDCTHAPPPEESP